MKVVHVVESLAVGGLERVVLSLASWQRARGDVGLIICLFSEGALAAEARAVGIEVIAIGKDAGLDFRALRALRTALRGSVPDVLHTHNAVAHYYAAASAIGLGIRCVINTRHGMGSHRASWRLDRLYRLSLIGTDVVAAVCKAGCDHFVQAGVVPARKSTVVPNGVAVDRIEVRHASARGRLLGRIGRRPETVLIGTVGRLSPVKDQGTLLAAVHRLRASGRAVELLLVGDGESRSTLETLARSLGLDDVVHFLGMRQDVHQLLSAFDIFVLSSLSEGYSLALVEAAAAALPIVATRVGGNADIVVELTTGLLVPAGNADALADALARLVDDAASRERMGTAGRQWALQYGSIEAMGQAYLDIYQRVLVGHGRTHSPGAKIPGAGT